MILMTYNLYKIGMPRTPDGHRRIKVFVKQKTEQTMNEALDKFNICDLSLWSVRLWAHYFPCLCSLCPDN